MVSLFHLYICVVWRSLKPLYWASPIGCGAKEKVSAEDVSAETFCPFCQPGRLLLQGQWDGNRPTA